MIRVKRYDSTPKRSVSEKEISDYVLSPYDHNISNVKRLLDEI